MPMKMEEEKPSKRYTSKIGKEERKEERAKAMKDKYPDPFFERNEFKEGFYNQPSQPLTDAETMYGKGTKRGFEYPTVDPDTKMMQDAQGMAKGGSVTVKTKLGKNKATKLY